MVVGSESHTCDYRDCDQECHLRDCPNLLRSFYVHHDRVCSFLDSISINCLRFGMSHGIMLVTWNDLPILSSDGADCPITPNPLWIFLLFPFLSAAINYFFQSNLRQYPIMFMTSAVSFLASYLISTFTTVGPQIPTTVSAICVGLISNAYSRYKNDVAIAPLLSGILLLVPGSLGVKSSLGILGNTIADGTGFASKMIVIGMSITVVRSYSFSARI